MDTVESGQFVLSLEFEMDSKWPPLFRRAGKLVVNQAGWLGYANETPHSAGVVTT